MNDYGRSNDISYGEGVATNIPITNYSFPKLNFNTTHPQKYKIASPKELNQEYNINPNCIFAQKWDLEDTWH